MKPEFLNTQIDVRTANGRDDILLDALEIQVSDGTIYQSPPGSTTDGVSTPRFLWRIIPPNGDADFLPAVLHDAAYRNGLLIYCPVNDTWRRANLTRLQSDRLLREALLANGVGLIKRNVIYFALRLCGGKAFREDRK